MENIRQKLKHERDTGVPGDKIFRNLIFLLHLLIFVWNVIKELFKSLLRKFKTVVKPVDKDIVLITGTGHGIGKELALQYAALGATVICWDMNKETNDETVEEIRKNGQKAYGYVCNVGNKEQVSKVAEKVRAEVGNVTVLVNNAGIMPAHLLTQHTEQEIRKVFEVCVFAQFWTIQEFLPQMVENKRGHIVNLSSIAGVNGYKNLVPYCGAKFAVRGISTALIQEIRETYKNADINVTCIYPTMVDTGLLKRVRVKFENCPMFGMQQPKYVAGEIIKAMRRNVREKTIPGFFFPFITACRNFPAEVQDLIVDFMDNKLDSDL